MNTIIEMQVFGDFDVRCTNCIMVSDEKLNIENLQKEFCDIERIPSFKGLEVHNLSMLTDKFILFLKTKGFRKLQTTELYFCD